MTRIRRVITTNSHLARNQMIAEIHAHWNEIEQLAVSRAEGQGQREYGNQIFSKPPSMLRRDRFEEYADALVYFQVQHEQE